MEIQPTVTVNPATGEEVISYDQAVVIDHSYIDDVQRQHHELEQRAFYEDANGLHNHWSDQIPDEEDYEQQVEQQYEDSDDDDSAEAIAMDEFAGSVLDQIGRSNYQTMIDWAQENLAEDWCQAYNDAIDSNDVAYFEQYLLKLINIFNEYN